MRTNMLLRKEMGDRVLLLISEIRSSVPDSSVYRHGSCMNLFAILKVVYPQAQAWWNNNHIITCINGKFYDIGGRVYNTKGYTPFASSLSKKDRARAFVDMYY